jgi:hypothetical protein
MEPIGKIAQTYSPTAQQQRSAVKIGSPEKCLPKPVVSALFVRLKAHYGQPWSNRFSNENELAVALVEWGVALVKYTNDEINTAMTTWMHTNPQWAPTLGQFERCCEEAYRNAKPEPKAPTIVKASTAARDREWEKIRQIGYPIKKQQQAGGAA